MSSHSWVLADPFRAHVRHLCQTSGLPWRVVAAAAGVSPRCVGTLLKGRDGQRRARLREDDARRLYRVTVGQLREGAVRLASPEDAGDLVRVLLLHGATIAELTTLTATGPTELENLRDGRAFGVRQLLLWRLRAVADARALDPADVRVAPATTTGADADTRIAA